MQWKRKGQKDDWSELGKDFHDKEEPRSTEQELQMYNTSRQSVPIGFHITSDGFSYTLAMKIFCTLTNQD